MSRPRLVLVTRRFWPLVGGAELLIARLAAGLLARGADTMILTARWQPDWPGQIEHHGVRVVRLHNPRWRGWGTLRYMQALARWLRNHRSRFDLAYVSMLKHDAYATVGEGRRAGFPVALRAEGAGLTGDCHWQLDARCGLRIKRRCMEAQAFVAPSPAVERELIAAGYPRDRIHLVPNGVAIPALRDAEARRAARRALAEAEPELKLPPDAPLAVYTGRLHEMKGLAHLVDAWPLVLARYPAARLWLVGEGPYRAQLAGQIQRLGLAAQVLLTGPFDDVEDFLLAADLFLLPSLEEGMSLALLEAMAIGLPLLASDISANRLLVEQGRHGKLVTPGDPGAIASGVLELLGQPGMAAELGDRARRRVSDQYSLDRMIDDHLALFERLLSQE